MKKAYVKPEIVFESFLLSTSIAGNCESIVGNPSKNVCGIPDENDIPGMNLFIGTVNGCDIKVAEDEYTDGNNTFCYHNPTEYNNLFNS